MYIVISTLMFFQIRWAINKDSNVIFPNSEFIFYGVLDVLLIPGSGAAFLWSHHEREPAFDGKEPGELYPMFIGREFRRRAGDLRLVIDGWAVSL